MTRDVVLVLLVLCCVLLCWRGENTRGMSRDAKATAYRNFVFKEEDDCGFNHRRRFASVEEWDETVRNRRWRQFVESDLGMR